MSFVRVKQSFATADRVYVAGVILDASDPVVKPGREALFEAIEDAARPVVEQATAAPGEKRTRTRKATAVVTTED